MKPLYISLLFFAVLLNSSCKENALYGPPNEKPENVFKDFSSFWSYHYKYTSLTEDFIPLDFASNLITKDIFFNRLQEGDCIPLRLTSAKNIYYKLYKIPASADASIATTMISTAQREYKLFKMTGKPLINFEWIDLDKKIYNPGNTKGNILVLKFWFIHCQKCNEEIPDCNKLVAKFKEHKDINFISLATDNEANLNKFLTKTTLDYTVVGNQEKYLKEGLGIEAYPTHMIINRDGIVVKVSNNFEEIEPALNKVISNTAVKN